MRAFKHQVVRATRYGNATMVVIPRLLVRDMGILLGDHFAMRRAGNSIVISPMESAIRARFAEDEAAVHAVTKEPATP